jgi:hypothetical protein
MLALVRSLTQATEFVFCFFVEKAVFVVIKVRIYFSSAHGSVVG